MSRFAPYLRGGRALALCVLAFALGFVTGCGSKGGGGPPAPAKAKPNAAKAKPVATETNSSSEYVSVFEDLLPPKGRDPFFPASGRRVKVIVATPGVSVHVEPSLVLHAIIGTSKHAEAVINNAILEVGEEPTSIRVPNGPNIVLKCLEIGGDYVVIQVAGEASPRRLTIQRKKN